MLNQYLFSNRTLIMQPIRIRCLSGLAVAEIAFGNDAILDAIERSLCAQGKRQMVLEYFAALVAPRQRDRSLAPDIETMLVHFTRPVFIELMRQHPP